MGNLTKNHTHRIGLPPGTLILPPGRESKTTKISLIHWTPEKLSKVENIKPNEIIPWLKEPGTTWVQVEGIHDLEALKQLGKIFELHPLMLEDISNPIQRPKLDDYQDKIFITMDLMHYDPKKMQIDGEQFCIVMGPAYLISFAESSNGLVDPVVNRLHSEQSRIRNRGSDYATYALIDLIVDYSFGTIDAINTVLDEIEEQMLKKPPRDATTLIQKSKKLVWSLRSSLLPMREVASQFQRLDAPWIEKKTTKFYMHDVSDHIYQALDLIESFRDTTLSLLDIHHSYQAQKMNEVMRTLTVVTTIFVPLTFISSLYGMNFKFMPELEWVGGYPMALAIMFSLAVGMLFYFRKQDWI